MGRNGERQSRTISQVPAATRASPASFDTVIGWRATPSRPCNVAEGEREERAARLAGEGGYTIATVNWPAIVAAVRPPAPRARTVQTIEAT